MRIAGIKFNDIVDGEEAKALFQKIANWVDSI